MLKVSFVNKFILCFNVYEGGFIMSKILKGEELKKFIDDLNIKYDEEIFSIILVLDDECKYVINGSKIVPTEKEIIEKYM